tara:strand:+ start:424 stop:1191 length:768 start_codon:yes stop_codon:yes gene_type:complete
MKNKSLSIIFFIPLVIFSQNIEMYLSLIDQGQIEGVKEQLPALISKYPNNPDILFLAGVLSMDGNKSYNIYKELLENFPDSKYAPDAAVKIGEYYYSLGLYSQAGTQLSKIPRIHSNYPDIERVAELMVSSFKAIGEADSAKYYSSIYKSMFPNLELDKFDDVNKFQSKVRKKERGVKKPYIIQVGAFGNISNAERMRLQISQVGYDVEISEVQINGRGLHAVRVVRYETKSEAEKVGRLVKNKLGIDYRVLYRP